MLMMLRTLTRNEIELLDMYHNDYPFDEYESPHDDRI